jgi:topoisomerase-4 subunit B
MIAMHTVKHNIAKSTIRFKTGQNTTHGGHLAAYREAIVKTIREFYNKSFEASDVRKSIVSAISIKVMEPVFESQLKLSWALLIWDQSRGYHQCVLSSMF